MEIKEIEEELDSAIEDMPWTYKHWKRENSLEFRNLGTHMTQEQVSKLFEGFMDDLEKEGFCVLLEGKAGVVLEDDEYWLCGISRKGDPGDKDKRLDAKELEDLFEKSLNRIDGSPLPSNRVVIDVDNIIDVYYEYVNEGIFLNLNVRGSRKLVLRGDGGLHIEIE